MRRTIADDETCPSCGQPLVYWLPDHIGIADVPNEIRTATTLPRRETVDTSQPLHPGRYCESGCIAQLFNFGNDTLWKGLEEARRQRETASLIVRPLSHAETPLKDFKIYLDRIIRTTAPRDRASAPKHCEYIELEPGNHSIDVRDYDHLGANRRVSNTVHFSIAPQEQLTFSLALLNGQLQLRNDG